MAEYRIDELAHESGTTVRNIRAYQDRGILPPPRLAGRVGIYDDSHLARLRVIAGLLGRGYTAAVIKDLLSAWETGKEIGDVLGLEKVLTDPWSDELPGTATTEELIATFGPQLDDARMADVLERATELGLIEHDGESHDRGRYRVPSPRLLQVGAELVAAGVPVDAVLTIAARIRDDCHVIAARFVGLVEEHLFHDLTDDPVTLTAERVVEVAEVVHRMRPLVKMVVDPFIARSMETLVQNSLGDRLELVRERLGTTSA